MRTTLAAALAFALAAFSPAFGWGPLGHRIVAETAALVVQDDLPKTWGPIVARHRFELGVYAFYPDTLFRHADGGGGKIEAPTHYLNLDAKADDGGERGSVDRRIDQFLEQARGHFQGVTKPAGGYLRGATATGDARRVFLGLYDLGVLAHYSGDTAMPYHATKDWNGFASGEGGIHFYLENDCVNASEPGLAVEVLASARKNRGRWLREWKARSSDPGGWVGVVLEGSLSAVATVSSLDKAHAVTKLQPPGSRATAERKPPAEGCRAMRKLLVDRLARGAALTATLWESVLPEGVDFGEASDLQFSDMVLDPDYLPPR